MAFKENLKNARLRAGMTLDEVAKAVGTTRQTVQKYESGVIPNVPSDKIEKMADVLDTTPAALMGWDVDSMNLPDNIVPITTMRIPILGDIACGVPAYAQEDFECYAEVGTNVRCDFALRARGDSMIGAGIKDGYLVFIRRQPDVLDGEIAAVIIDDEATLKRVRHLQGGAVLLLAENPKYEPILLGGEGETRYINIIGKAVAFQGDIA
jgi:repressor LexA